MLSTALPPVPFVIQPRKEWEKGMEKKERFEIIYDSDEWDSSSESDNVSTLSDSTDSSVDTQEEIQKRIRTMLVENPEGYGY